MENEISISKFIFVTGGVTSSLGKGIVAASLAKLLQARGLRVTIQKFDPYINVDPGTLNPYEHGECYVTEDGAETDLDLGHYERFLNIHTTQANNVTTGRIYQTVINKEREGAFLGKTVQVVPHITDEIKRRMKLLGQTGEYDIVITEIGGTVGDIESLPFVEALRQLQWELPEHDTVVVHLTLIPYLKAAKELKTKPTQHSVRMLSEEGVHPDIIVCRTERPLSPDLKRKIALFCNVKPEAVVEAADASTIYEVPVLMMREGLDTTVLKKLNLTGTQQPDLTRWKLFLDKLKYPKAKVNVGLIGKYIELQDAYKSILESFIHAGAINECQVQVINIHSEFITSENVNEKLAGLDALLVAPGFGHRGVEGKIVAVKYAREKKLPFFGICLGMQMAAIEFARNVLGLKSANSTEMNPDIQTNSYPVAVQKLGNAFFTDFDLVIAGLDNREARIWLGAALRRLDKIWIDGAIEGLMGKVQTFVPEGPCYACTMTDQEWLIIAHRRSCSLLGVEEILGGHTPTNATTTTLTTDQAIASATNQ